VLPPIVGSFAKVKEAIDLHAAHDLNGYVGGRSTSRVALKIYHRKQLRKIPGGLDSVTREVQILNRLRIDALCDTLLHHSDNDHLQQQLLLHHHQHQHLQHHHHHQFLTIESHPSLRQSDDSVGRYSPRSVRIQSESGRVTVPGDETSPAHHSSQPLLEPASSSPLSPASDTEDSYNAASDVATVAAEDNDADTNHPLYLEPYATNIVHILDHFQEGQKMYVPQQRVSIRERESVCVS
jgi:hypothetical protein